MRRPARGTAGGTGRGTRQTAGIGLRLSPILLLGPLLAAGCGSAPEPGPPPATAPPAARTAAPPATARPTARPALCRARRATVLGRIDDPALDELSGLARGRARPGVLFAVEDSGAAPVLTAVRTDASVLGHPALTGAAAVDWEDIAAGPGPDGGAALFVGDIGDNDAEREAVQVYRVPEPAPEAAATAPAARLELRYPDGPHDAETLLLDPLRHELIVVTKSLTGGRAYRTPSAFAPGTRATLRRGPAVRIGPVSGGDLSADGRILALRSYGSLAVWQRHGREPLSTTLARGPTCVAPAALAAEGQGEALALDARGRTAITAPEGPQPLLRRYG